MTTKEIVVGPAEEGRGGGCSCECPNLIEVKLRIKACQCKAKVDTQRTSGVVDKICECLKRSNSKSNFLKIDFVDGHSSDPEDCQGEKRRSVLVLKLNDLDVKCENGLRHELYFPAAAVAGKDLSPGDCLAYSMSSTGDIHEHKPIPVPGEVRKEVVAAATCNTRSKKTVQRQISKSMDDVKPQREKPVKSRSAQNMAEKASVVGGSSMSDMDSIELIIISDEFLNDSQNQEVIIVNEQRGRRMSPTTRSKSFQIKKKFLHDTGAATNGKERGDYFKRAAEAKAKTAQLKATTAATTAGKRLVIVSDEFKRKSQASTVKIVKSKEKLPVKPKKSMISNAMVDLNSKIISCVLQSYEEPERLENKALQAQMMRAKLSKKSSFSTAQHVTPKQ